MRLGAALFVALCACWSASAATAATTGSIAGLVVSDATGQPIQAATITIDPLDFPVYTDAAGRFAVSGLTPGDYRVGFAGDLAGNYLPEWYMGKPDEEHADAVIVNAGDTTFVSVALRTGGQIAGHVTDAKGTPVAGVEVNALSTTGSGWTRSDAQGDYVVWGLSSGAYELDFSPAEGGSNYAPMAYRQKPQNSALVDLVPVSVGHTTTDVNATMMYPGVVTGHVTDPSGQPLAGVAVAVVADAESGGNFVQHLTDAFGDYVIADVFPWASYRVLFVPPPGPFAQQYFRNTPTFDTATPIAVSERGTVRGVDAVLGFTPEPSAPVLFGRVTFAASATTDGRVFRLIATCTDAPACPGRLQVRTHVPRRLRHRGSPRFATILDTHLILAGGRHTARLRLSSRARRIVAHEPHPFHVTVRINNPVFAGSTVRRSVKVRRR